MAQDLTRRKRFASRKARVRRQRFLVAAVAFAVLLLAAGATVALGAGRHPVKPVVRARAAVKTTPVASIVTTSAATTPLPSTEATLPADDSETRGLPVLMYHDFYDPAKGETAPAMYAGDSLDINSFEEQLAWLHDNGYSFPSWDEVLAFTQGRIKLPEKSVVLTCDDGTTNFFSEAIPLVEKYQAHITCFLIGERVDPVKTDLTSYDPRFVTFESHSYALHVGNESGDGLITTTSDEGVIADIIRETRLIGPHTVFCYPFGRAGRDYSEREEQILAEHGYQLAFTVTNGRVYPGMDPMALPRVRVDASTITLDGFKALVQ
ncbi:MAG: polysaccharide deacetylase family protein [Actinomycetia bacterium]|nr:polysaccharide deacetylase family protein [Actinomycetes bacterium]